MQILYNFVITEMTSKNKTINFDDEDMRILYRRLLVIYLKYTS